MTDLPRSGAVDSTAALLIEGYEFVSNRCRALGSDVFETRLYLQPTICMRGRAAAELFYGSPSFTRHGAAPRRMRKTLFGDGGVQGLDDGPHRHRKAMFLSMMTPERIDDLVAGFEGAWRRRLRHWSDGDGVVLYDEIGSVLTDAVHEWAGVPLDRDRIERRRDLLHALIVGGGGLGPNYLGGRLARKRLEREFGRLIGDVRDGREQAPMDSPLDVIARHRTTDGELLDLRTAAVALLNVLRPTVAVDRFVVFLALALEEHPGWRERLAGADDAEIRHFVQEVRRYYPFFPFAAARAAETFEWQGYRFREGWRVLLDLYATDHDPTVWASPATFDPDRFADWDDDPYDLVPQGGGDHRRAHRCAGEWATIALMERATRLLVDGMTYDLPEQDLRLQRGKVPALPTSGLVITDVTPAAI